MPYLIKSCLSMTFNFTRQLPLERSTSRQTKKTFAAILIEGYASSTINASWLFFTKGISR
jgi:hypothetical protein